MSDLIREGVLDIKIAVSGGDGIYHDKLGILKDYDGDTLVFYGSPNSSYGGYRANYEKIRVVKGWEYGNSVIVDDEEKEFESLWNNQNSFVETFEYKEIALSNNLEVISKKRSEKKDNPGIELRDYQEEAIRAWVSAGAYHTVGLKADGTVVSTSITDDDYDYEQTEVNEWQDIVMISANESHTLGLKSDGTVVAVGSDEYWQTAVDEWKDIVAVSAGVEHSVGLKADGTVIGVGGDPIYQDDRSELDKWEDIIAVSAGYGFTMGLKSDGSIVFANNFEIDHDESLININEWKDIANPGYKPYSK